MISKKLRIIWERHHPAAPLLNRALPCSHRAEEPPRDSGHVQIMRAFVRMRAELLGANNVLTQKFDELECK